MISILSQANIPIKGCTVRGICYPSTDGKEHFALIADYGDKVPLVRIHSECLTGDVFGSERCDCGQQLAVALERICQEGGVLIYLRQEGRGIGLFEKLKAYFIQDESHLDTVEANVALGHPIDGRTYGKAVQILKDLNISALALMTNNPEKVKALQEAGLHVTEVLPCQTIATESNKAYLETKKLKMEHCL